jgi:predicted DNA-binding transcriptional regulator AlpA
MSATLDNIELIADPLLAKKLGVSTRTLARWDEEPEKGLPKPIVFSRRKYRRAHEIEAWINERALASLGPKAKGRA